MKSIKAIVILLFFSSFAGLQGQNVDYSGLEKRFVKKEPSAQDTAAFRELGEQKVRQLFDKSQFYSQNYSNVSNQVYVKKQIPDLFYLPTGDSLDVNGIILAIEDAKLINGQSIELRTTPKKGFLGMTETLNAEPKFTFYLVLKQIPKNFGNEQELVWQVFLHKPEQRDTRSSKSGKAKTVK